MSVRIQVIKTGWGSLKPPENINRFINVGGVTITNPKWIDFNVNRKDTEARAVNSIDKPLLPGEYQAQLMWQYYSDTSEAWFRTDDPRIHKSFGNPIRLVYCKIDGTARIV